MTEFKFKEGDKVYVIRDAEICYNDDFYIGVADIIEEKTVTGIGYNFAYWSSSWYTFSNNEIAEPKYVFATLEEAKQALIELRKKDWEDYNCEEMLNKLLKIKEHLKESQDD